MENQPEDTWIPSLPEMVELDSEMSSVGETSSNATFHVQVQQSGGPYTQYRVIVQSKSGIITQLATWRDTTGSSTVTVSSGDFETYYDYAKSHSIIVQFRDGTSGTYSSAFYDLYVNDGIGTDGYTEFLRNCFIAYFTPSAYAAMTGTMYAAVKNTANSMTVKFGISCSNQIYKPNMYKFSMITTQYIKQVQFPMVEEFAIYYNNIQTSSWQELGALGTFPILDTTGSAGLSQNSLSLRFRIRDTTNNSTQTSWRSNFDLMMLAKATAGTSERTYSPARSVTEQSSSQSFMFYVRSHSLYFNFNTLDFTVAGPSLPYYEMRFQFFGTEAEKMTYHVLNDTYYHRLALSTAPNFPLLTYSGSTKFDAAAFESEYKYSVIRVTPSGYYSTELVDSYFEDLVIPYAILISLQVQAKQQPGSEITTSPFYLFRGPAQSSGTLECYFYLKYIDPAINFVNEQVIREDRIVADGQELVSSLVGKRVLGSLGKTGGLVDALMYQMQTLDPVNYQLIRQNAIAASKEGQDKQEQYRLAQLSIYNDAVKYAKSFNINTHPPRMGEISSQLLQVRQRFKGSDPDFAQKYSEHYGTWTPDGTSSLFDKSHKYVFKFLNPVSSGEIRDQIATDEHIQRREKAIEITNSLREPSLMGKFSNWFWGETGEKTTSAYDEQWKQLGDTVQAVIDQDDSGRPYKSNFITPEGELTTSGYLVMKSLEGIGFSSEQALVSIKAHALDKTEELYPLLRKAGFGGTISYFTGVKPTTSISLLDGAINLAGQAADYTMDLFRSYTPLTAKVFTKVADAYMYYTKPAEKIAESSLTVSIHKTLEALDSAQKLNLYAGALKTFAKHMTLREIILLTNPMYSTKNVENRLSTSVALSRLLKNALAQVQEDEQSMHVVRHVASNYFSMAMEACRANANMHGYMQYKVFKSLAMPEDHSEHILNEMVHKYTSPRQIYDAKHAIEYTEAKSLNTLQILVDQPVKLQDFIDRITSHLPDQRQTAFNGGMYIINRGRRIYELPQSISDRQPQIVYNKSKPVQEKPRQFENATPRLGYLGKRDRDDNRDLYYEYQRRKLF